MRRDPILGFFGRAGLTPGRGVGRTASGGIGPTRHSLDRGVPRPRPERDLGDDGLALRPRRATTCLGEGWAARAIHSLRVHKREPRSQQHRWTPRGPAPSRRSITGHGAQKAGAHTLRASACATAEGAGGASARSQRAHIAHPWTGKRCRITLGPPAGGACSRRARSAGDGAACWQRGE